VLLIHDQSRAILLSFELLTQICLFRPQISGEFMNVRDALCLVNWKLRNHVFSFMGNKNDNGCVPASNLAKSNATSQVNLSSTDQYSAESCQRVDYGPSLGYGMDPVEKSFSDFQLSSSEVQVIFFKRFILSLCFALCTFFPFWICSW
jgi:hypothetical protein